MEGVNILTQTEIMVYPEWHTIAVIVALIATMSGFGLAFGSRDGWPLMVGLYFTTCGFVALLVFGLGSYKEPAGRYRYQATISDEVSLNDIYERYEIVDKDGELWTLEDKEVED